MLSKLHIENFAIIESADIVFAAGLNAITGETGAGKSILVGALELALGERASSDVVRSGQKIAIIEAHLHPPFPPAVFDFIRSELNLEWELDEPLILRREISAQGRSRCFIAGQLINVADLKKLGEQLADLHGQHEHQSLFHPAAQRVALDAFGNYEKQIADYRARYAEYVRLRKRRDDLLNESRDFEKRLDYLHFQIDEIEQVGPRSGELAELEAEQSRLAHADTLARAAEHAYGLLYEGIEDEGRTVIGTLGEVQRDLNQIGRLDPAMAGLAGKIGEIEALVEDLSLEIRRYSGLCEPDPDRLNEVIERQENLGKLLRKHGAGAAGENELIAILDLLRSERDGMKQDAQEREEIEDRLVLAESELRAQADRLFETRTATAKKLGGEVGKTLAEVAMEKAIFRIEVMREEQLGPDGGDRVEFLLAANPGEGIKPLRDVASGGELSRTMLAIKTALAKRDSIPTLVFDEIDAGISGETAARVGRLMEKLAGSHQIICITHHASIAARAGHHLSVRKNIQKGRTTVATLALDKEERIEELARMMGGEGKSDEGKKLAKKLMA